MTRGTYWRCVACGFACDKDDVCPDCGYHTLVQEDFPERTWVGLPDDIKKAVLEWNSKTNIINYVEEWLKEKNK